jgi:hypothetical protein
MEPILIACSKKPPESRTRGRCAIGEAGKTAQGKTTDRVSPEDGENFESCDAVKAEAIRRTGVTRKQLRNGTAAKFIAHPPGNRYRTDPALDGILCCAAHPVSEPAGETKTQAGSERCWIFWRGPRL